MPEPDAVELFNEVLEIDSGREREAFLEQACSEDQRLRRRVKKLLAAHLGAGEFLGGGGTEGTEKTEAFRAAGGQAPLLIGSMIGPYKIREQIGEGGMGSVYVAEQTKPVKRRVALKLIRAGLGGGDVVGRFEAERQALAMMDHPNIARVLDGGTTDSGQPYFAMELVQGLPITAYCDERQLSTNQRLSLFLDVCRAVQHAHQRGIIHRDIKPSNVMVAEIDDKAVAKVIDFGLAKAVNQKLTDHTVYTQFSQMMGTPLYMSPEQAGLGVLDIDTRSDIYSLGVLLYELLTGNTPFDRKALNSVGCDEMRRIIREDEPRRPSAMIGTLGAEAISTVSDRRRIDPRRFAHTLRGELDWIVMKSLEKDRVRRYESASSLAADIERHLNGDAVEACPPSIGYRIQKYSRRHKAAIVTTTLIAAALLIGTGVSLWQAVVAQDARIVAEQAQATAEQETEKATAATAKSEANLAAALDAVERLLAHVSNPELAKIPRMQETLVSMMKDAVEFYERFKKTSGGSPDVDYRAAKVFLQFGHLLTATKPDSDDVIHQYERGLELADAIVVQQPKRNDFRELQAELNLGCADYYWFPKDSATKAFDAQAIEHLQSAQEQYAYLTLAEPGTEDYRLRQGYAFARLAMLHLRISPKDPRVKELIDRATELGHVDYIAQAVIATSDDPKLAAQYWRKAIAEYRSDPDQSTKGSPIRWAGLAANSLVDEDPELAEWILQEAIKWNYQLHNDFPYLSNHWHQFDQRSLDYAKLLLRVENRPRALGTSETLIQSDPAFHSLRAKVLDDWNDPDEQLQMLNESIQSFPTQAEYYRVRAEVFENRGEFGSALLDLNHVLELDQTHSYAYKRRGDLHSKLANYQQAIDDYATWFSMHGSSDLHNVYKRRAAAYFELGQYTEALADLNRAIDQHPNYLSTLTYISLAKVAACPDQEFRSGMLQLADRVVELNDSSAKSLMARGSLLDALGHKDRAIEDLEKAIELEPDNAQVYNTIAWSIASDSSANPDLVKRAVSWAEKAVALDADSATTWNTLGVAQYRAADFDGAVESLEKSENLSDGRDIAYNGLFLAMAHARLGEQEKAQQWYEKAIEWIDANPADDELQGFQSEAEQLLESLDITPKR